MMVGLPKDTSDCTNMQDDLSRIATWGNIFKNPMEAMPMIFSNLMANYVDIIRSLDAMNGLIANKRHPFAIGIAISDIMVDILGPIPAFGDSQKIDEASSPVDTDAIEYTQW